ncbi:MAG: transglutaminase-like domain-containing protein [Pseudomonadota bacterium]
MGTEHLTTTLTLPRSPGMLGLALLFWGLTTGYWGIASLLALVLEAPRWTAWRWSLQDTEFNRFVDFTLVLLIGTLLYVINRGGGGQGVPILELLRWLPLIFWPLVAVQEHSRQGSVAFKSLFYSLRRSRHLIASQRFDVGLIYWLICLLAASMDAGVWFFPGAATLTLWILWPLRRPGARWGWGLQILAGGILAFGIAQGLQILQDQVEDWALMFYSDWFADRDPFRQQTRLGEIGSLKASSQVLFRVWPAAGTEIPLRLRQTSFNVFFDGTWRNRRPALKSLVPFGEGDEWILAPPGNMPQHVRIAFALDRGRGLLPLPLGTQRLGHLPAAQIEADILGAVRISEGPGLVLFDAWYGDRGHDAPPQADDLAVPANERPALAKTLAAWKLTDSDAATAAERIRVFFDREFTYSLTLPVRQDPALTPLGDFLLKSHQGHCEYFASAAVLLLRSLGIPARYASGFSVQEYQPWDGAYWVRRRHAHAWALMWDGERWRDLDPTPALWAGWEDQWAGQWQSLGDLWGYTALVWSEWRWTAREMRAEDFLPWLLILLSGLLAWRLWRKERLVTATSPAKNLAPPPPPTPFDAILEHLETRYGTRPTGEPLRNWLTRIGYFADDPDIPWLWRRHQQIRFHAQGLEEVKIQEFAARVRHWLISGLSPAHLAGDTRERRSE